MTFPGTVAQRGVERGGFASQAAPAYTVMDLSTIKVEVGVSEQVVNTIAIGDEVAVKMTAVSAEPLTGRVSTISPSAGQTGTYTVKIELNNQDKSITVYAGAACEAKPPRSTPRWAITPDMGEVTVQSYRQNRAE